MTKPYVIAVANQKGGVGKTTTAVNVGAALAARERSVWLLDLDPQGNATTSLGHPAEADLAQVLLQTTSAGARLKDTPSALMRILTGGPKLAGFDGAMATHPQRERRLAEVIAALSEPPDFILVDCPPSLSLLTTNALVAARHVLIPLQCEFLALQGLAQLLDSITQVRERANAELDILGIVLTMHDRRNSLSEHVAANVRAVLPNMVFETVIPRNVRASEAPSHGLPVLLYDVRSPSAQAYIALAREIEQRLETSR